MSNKFIKERGNFYQLIKENIEIKDGKKKSSEESFKKISAATGKEENIGFNMDEDGKIFRVPLKSNPRFKPLKIEGAKDYIWVDMTKEFPEYI